MIYDIATWWQQQQHHHHHHHQSLVSTMLGSAAWILFLHSDLFWAQNDVISEFMFGLRQNITLAVSLRSPTLLLCPNLGLAEKLAGLLSWNENEVYLRAGIGNRKITLPYAFVASLQHWIGYQIGWSTVFTIFFFFFCEIDIGSEAGCRTVSKRLLLPNFCVSNAQEKRFHILKNSNYFLHLGTSNGTKKLH